MQVINLDIEAFVRFSDNDIGNFLQFCEDIINNVTKDSDTNYKLKSAVHELLINSLEHGYKKNAGNISISIKKFETYILFELSDKGNGIDLNRIDLNKTVSDLESLSSRGWGLAITNKMSDGMQISSNSPSGTKISLKFSI
jgi:stage II sporulation protein AB (anti-sigma F factor)